MAEVEVEKNESGHRYEAFIEGELAGFAAYEVDGTRIVFTHTEVDDRFEGQGVGSKLARAALDEVRADGAHQVVPQCRFIKSWIEKHPDYQDLLESRDPAS